MRIALAVPRVLPDWRANLETIRAMSAAAGQARAQLIVFSEAAVTGFRNTGDPWADLALGQPVPGPASTLLARTARDHRLWVAVGLFERDQHTLYDAALLFAPDGSIRLHYRRIDPHWHHWHSRPGPTLPYAQGTQMPVASTPWGTCAFLLCGDLFNKRCQALLAALKPAWLLFPMARGFDTEVFSVAQWQAQERYYYLEEARKAGVTMLLVNQLTSDMEPDFCYFGGALVVSKDGTILAEHPLEQAGLLVADLEDL